MIDGFCIAPTAADPVPAFREEFRDESHPDDANPLQTPVQNQTRNPVQNPVQSHIRLAQLQAHVLATINTTLVALGGEPLARFTQLFECADTMICSFAEMDPCARADTRAFIGPLFSVGTGDSVQWPATPSKKIFAYLKLADKNLEPTQAALKALPNASIVVHVPGASTKLIAAYSTRQLQFAPRLVDLATVTAECDLMICNAGTATPAAMLLGGVPLLLLPYHHEQLLNARRTQALGAAAVVLPDEMGDFARRLAKALEDKTLTEAAQRFAQKYRHYD